AYPKSVPAFPVIASALAQLSPDQLRNALRNFLPQNASPAEQVRAVEAALNSPTGQSLRDAMARWIVDEIVPVERLVPESYIKWRAPVRDCMIFVVSRISTVRLAPKLLEQLELPSDTSPETRLLRLIAKVPGLQKLGQVIARNQHLRPALRNALARLENGIRDVQPKEIRRIIEAQLADRLKNYEVKIASTILSEASVSAVIRFTWRNPVTHKREHGVFKVLKPHIPQYFAEDMEFLQALARHFGDRHHSYGFPRHLIPDTFNKVRRLLQHEVDFAREQKTLVEAEKLYRSMADVRIPGLIKPLSTPTITALTEERGIKVTNAAARLPAARRRRITEQLVEALIAVPLLSAQEDAIFHGDPHSGNLLYDSGTGTLTIIDWALREHLSRNQRRHLALLFLMLTLRDTVGVSHEILALSQDRVPERSSRVSAVRDLAATFLNELPVNKFPSGADTMKLLERVALKGIKFPGSLVMLSKVMFTLDGILNDISATDSGTGLTLARHIAQRWITDRALFRSPLLTRDWITLQCSALLYTGRLWLQCEQAILDRVLPAAVGFTP
ncbi:MAG: phosphotransferase, partial [Acidobacteriaceae bacterium]|nr:phosphotransferase [Acidobacteriaceae bacterium]